MAETNDKLEVVRTDEEAVLKTVAGDEPVGGSIPSASAPSPKKKVQVKKEKEDPGEPRYKLNIYRLNGTLRPDISKAVYLEMGRKWGDIIRCIPSHRFSTFEEILNFVWQFEAKQYRKAFTRTRKQVEEAVRELVQSNFLIVKTH